VGKRRGQDPAFGLRAGPDGASPWLRPWNLKPARRGVPELRNEPAGVQGAKIPLECEITIPRSPADGKIGPPVRAKIGEKKLTAEIAEPAEKKFLNSCLF
jgi:hypothetical protein